MAIMKYSETWINGFAEQAARLGLDQEGAKTLLKFAAMYESSADPKFQEGFKAAASGLVKTAAPVPPIKPALDIGANLGRGLWGIGKKMYSSPGAATASTAGIGAALGVGYYGAWRPYVGRGPFEREAQAIRDAVDYGFLDEDQANIAITQLRRKSADKRLAGTGYSAKGNNSGYSWGWNSPY